MGCGGVPPNENRKTSFQARLYQAKQTCKTSSRIVVSARCAVGRAEPGSRLACQRGVPQNPDADRFGRGTCYWKKRPSGARRFSNSSITKSSAACSGDCATIPVS